MIIICISCLCFNLRALALNSKMFRAAWSSRKIGEVASLFILWVICTNSCSCIRPLVMASILTSVTQESILFTSSPAPISKEKNATGNGFAEFMAGIQVHHARLWFAGEAQNWELADFEVAEIKEALDGIKEYDTYRPESKSITMIEPAMDSMANAIKQKDPLLFRSSYTLLTNTCNNCHRATNHAFNIIKIPDTPPFSNQVFKAQ